MSNSTSSQIVFALMALFGLTAAVPIGVPVPTGQVVKLQHHGTIDGPSGRFPKTDFALPPVDLSVPPVALPEFTPIHEEQEDIKTAASDIVPQFERLQSLPLDDYQRQISSPEASAVNEPSQEVQDVARHALYFVRG